MFEYIANAKVSMRNKNGHLLSIRIRTNDREVSLLDFYLYFLVFSFYLPFQNGMEIL